MFKEFANKLNIKLTKRPKNIIFNIVKYIIYQQRKKSYNKTCGHRSQWQKYIVSSRTIIWINIYVSIH